jgi:hypothetical protein
VLTSFQFERKKGLGARNGWSDPPQWPLVDALGASGKADAVGFTSFPYLEYGAPAAIPSDYYDELSQHWGGPVVFTEIGWLAAPSGPFAGGEPDQSDFIGAFFDRASDLDLESCSWLFLHDWDQQSTTPAFANVGLRNNLATDFRLADETWRDAVELRQR